MELFREGRWGRICVGSSSSRVDHAKFTLDAQVICRQLGFPFGTVMDESERNGVYAADYGIDDGSDDDALVWADYVRS